VTVPEQFFVASVLRTWPLTPAMRRVVLGGPGLVGYRSTGVADEWFRFLFPATGLAPVALPRLVDGHWQLPSPEPLSRWYTVRHFDADRHELTVDVVVHGHGRGTRWAVEAAPGDQVVVSSPTGRRRTPAESDWELVVADLTGLPAASRKIEQLPAGRRVRAILEVPNEECMVPLDTDADLHVSWIFNPRPDVIPSALNLATRSLELPPGRGYVWMAGEAACSRDIRRYVRHELGWPSSSYDIVGYWRPDVEAYLRRYSAVEQQVAEIYEQSQRDGRDLEETADQVYAVMEAHGL
jgi:NADPH-dependent ferric siderophore reductase